MNGSWAASGPARDRYLVVKSSGEAGLGDKLRAVLSAIVYARLSGRRLYVDWTDTAYGDGVANYFNELFRLSGVQMAGERPRDGTVRPAAWQGKLHLNWDQLYTEYGIPPWNRAWAIDTFSFDQGILDWPEDVCVMWDFDQFHKLVPSLHRLFPNMRGDEPPEWLQGEVLRAHVEPSPGIAAAVARYLERIQAARPVLGVHVRGAEHTCRASGLPSLETAIQAVAKLRKRSRAKSIFLSTDSRAVQDRFRASFGAENVWWTEKWLPAPGAEMLLDRNCPDRTQFVRDSLRDILLLAAADGLVTFGASSFSILARMWSVAPEEQRLTLWQRAPLWQRALRRAGWGKP